MAGLMHAKRIHRVTMYLLLPCCTQQAIGMPDRQGGDCGGGGAAVGCNSLCSGPQASNPWGGHGSDDTRTV